MLPDREFILSLDDKKERKLDLKLKITDFFLDKVIEERCDEFDYNLESDGYIILERDYETAAPSVFNYRVTVYKN